MPDITPGREVSEFARWPADHRKRHIRKQLLEYAEEIGHGRQAGNPSIIHRYIFNHLRLGITEFTIHL